jgi:Flp pilus assembly pilin Flp
MLQNLIALTKFFKKERGQDLAEYSPMIGLMSVVIIAAAFLLGPAITNLFNFVVDALGNLIG